MQFLYSPCNNARKNAGLYQGEKPLRLNPHQIPQKTGHFKGSQEVPGRIVRFFVYGYICISLSAEENRIIQLQ